MADRYDDRYRDRWSDRDRDRNQEWDERHEQFRNRGWEGSSLSNYGDRDRRERENYPSNRYGNDDNRGSQDFRPEHERGGFVSRTPYMGEGPHEGRGGGYAQGNEGSYGASPTGATWGASEAARHRIGGLTDSAAESARRVQQRSSAQGMHAGRGPKNYQRSDERITDEICERLTRDPEVDATNIEITVQSGLVTLSGTVADRQSKRAAEDLANDVWGVKDVQNQIKVQRGDLLTSTSTDANQSNAQNTPPVVGHSAVPTTKH